jgi:hypothetical protein
MLSVAPAPLAGFAAATSLHLKMRWLSRMHRHPQVFRGHIVDGTAAAWPASQPLLAKRSKALNIKALLISSFLIRRYVPKSV